jgi:acyl-CoA synthetase (NDP forming)
VVTGTGGAAAMVADRLGMLGADVVPPSAAMVAKLAADNIHVNDSPITDIPMGGSDGGAYTKILSALLASDHCDAVVSVIGSSSKTNPQVITDRVLKAEPKNKPLAVFLAPRADDGLKLLQDHGVAGFRTPECCADAVFTYLTWRAPSADAAGTAAEIAGAEAQVARFSGDRLNEREAVMVFGALGVPSAKSAVVTSPAQAAGVAGPAAVKLLSPDILHKTDAGMVRLNVAAADIAGTVKDLLERARQHFPAAKVDGVLVQTMESGLAEVILGYRHDPEVGPVVLLGLGGTLAELRRSYSVRLAPVSVETAREMIAEVPELAVLNGFRGLPRGDTAALAGAVRAVSLLASVRGRTVAEAEINPLIVKAEGQGVVAVDGLVVFEGKSVSGTQPAPAVQAGASEVT